MAGEAPPWIDSWLSTKLELEEGAHAVNFEAMAQALRGNQPVPREVRDYLATLFEQKRVRRPQSGRTPDDKGNGFERQNIDDIVLSTYHIHLHLARLHKNPSAKTGTPHEIALERSRQALKKIGVNKSESGIKRIITKRKLAGYDLEEDPFWEPPDHKRR